MKKVIYPKNYVKASREQAYIVTFGWDSGNAESGPRWGKGEDVVYAISEDDACDKWETENLDQFLGSGMAYEGCWAKLATDDELRRIEDQNNDWKEYYDDTFSSINCSEEQAYIITYGWDTGGVESGPIMNMGEDLVYATSKQEACRKWEADNIRSANDDHSGYTGCSARLATEAEIREFEEERLLDEKAWEEAVRLGYVDPDYFRPDPDDYGEIFD